MTPKKPPTPDPMDTKKKYRTPGSGSIFQRVSDSRWIGTVEAGFKANGKRRRLTVSDKDKAKCITKQKALDREIKANGAGVEGISTRDTVQKWAPQWLALIQPKIRPKTWSGYQSDVNVWIIPTIGRKTLSTLTPADVRAVAKATRAAGRTASTARHAHTVLLAMLKAATLEGHAVPPRVLLVEAPGMGVSDRDAIPLEDTLAILRAAAGRTDASRWAAALLQGLRQGEALGLTWDALDLDRGVMDVSWQLAAIPYKHGCGDSVNGKAPCGRRFGGDCKKRAFRIPDGYEVRPLDGALCLVRPKTARGQRIIPLVPWMVTTLLAWRDIAPASPHGLVWPRPDGRPQLVDVDGEAWRTIQDIAQVASVKDEQGRRYGIHECRHSAATLLMEARVDPKTITSILGHSSIVTSRLYIHSSQDLALEALTGVAARLELT